MRHSLNIALCLLIFLVVYANSQSNWNFVLRSAVDTVQLNKQIDKCDTYVTSGQANTSAVWILNYTDPYNLASIYSNASAVGSTYGSDMRIVNYNSYGYYLFYVTTSPLITVARLSGSATTYAYDIGTPDYVRALYVDQDYPLMYYTGPSFLGVLNISNPTNAYKLAEFNTTQFLGQYPSSSMALASNYMYLAVMATYSTGSPTKLRWDISDFASKKLDAVYPLDYSYGYSVSVDPQNRYIGFRDSNGVKIFQMSPPYRLLTSISYSSSGVSVVFLGDYILIDKSSSTPFVIYKIVNGTTPPQGYQNISLQQQTSVYSSNLSGHYTPYGTRMYNGVLLAADTQATSAIAVSVTSDTGLNLTSLGQSLYYADSCHKRNGSPNFPLVLTASSPLIVDAQNLMPITNSQLLVTDMKKDVKWNYIRYAISAYSIPGMQFQYYDNTTKIWSNVSSFYQWDIFSGNVRLLPPYSFISTCQSGATVAAVVGNFTFTASDIWLRTLSSTLVNVAFVCCPSTNATVNATATINLIKTSPSTATQYCNAVMPGYYTDSSTRTIKACPLGTFNPNYGSVGLRNSCYSCPAGSTTNNIASTSWQNCRCSYCMLKKNETYFFTANSLNCAYMFRPQPLVQNPHMERPLLFTTALMTNSDGGVRFAFNSDVNGTSAYNPRSFETWLAAYSNSRLILRNGTGTSPFEIYNYQYAFSSDSWTQTWSFYWKGYLAQGFVPLNYDASSDFTFRDGLLSFFLNQNQSNIDPLYFKQSSQYQFALPTQPIRDIAYGAFGTSYTSYYQNSWLVASDDYINNQTVSTIPLTLASTFQTLGSGLSDSFAYTAIPASVLNVTSWFIFNTVPATWIDWTQNNFILSDNNPWKGLYYNLVLNNGDSNQNNWPLISSFTSQQMANSLVYIKILQNQTSFPASSFNISFQACHLWIRFCDFPLFNLTVDLPSFSASHIEISSWAMLSGNNSNSSISFTGLLSSFSSTNNPGGRNGSQVAFVPPDSIYLYGGTPQGASAPMSDFWLFNLNNNMWTKIKDNGAFFTGKASAKGFATLTNWPASTSFGSFVYHEQRNLLLLYGGSGLLNGSVWQYDLNTACWSWIGGDLTAQSCNASLYSGTGQPCPVSNFGESLVISGQMYCSMGYLNRANALQNAVWQFNPASYSFSLLNSATSGLNISNSSINPKTMYGSARQNEYQTNSNVPGSAFIYQFGGQNSSSGASGNAVWVFDIVLDSFKQISADLNISQDMLNNVSLGVETLVPFYPRAKSASVADIFGNIWIYGGLASGNAALLSDLWIYNTVAESYQWVSGTNQLTNIASTNMNASGVFGIVGSAYTENVPPAVNIPGSLAISYSTANNRSVTLYLVMTGGNYLENIGTQVWSLSAFVLPSSPIILQTALVEVNVSQGYAYIDKTFFTVTDYDTPAHKLRISLLSTANGSFIYAPTNTIVSSITYEMVQSGLQAYFSPIGSGNFTVPFTVTDDNGNTATSNFSISISCTGLNVNSTTCQCARGMYSLANRCVACLADTYKDDSTNTSCIQCPIGSYTNGATGVTNLHGCIGRPSFVLVDAISNSYACPSGTGLSSDQNSCVSCSADAFQTTNTLSSCSSCSVSTTTFNLLGQTRCWNSTEYAIGLNSQILCNVGFYANGDFCRACPAQTYKETTGNESCLTCSGASAQSCVGQSNASTSSQAQVPASVLIGVGVGAGLLALVALGATYIAFKRRKENKFRFLTKLAKPKEGLGQINITDKAQGTTPLTMARYGAQNTTGIMSVTSMFSAHESKTYSVMPFNRTRTSTQFTAGSLHIAFPAFLLIGPGGSYRVRDLIGEGGFAKLYKGDLIDRSTVPESLLQETPTILDQVAIKMFKNLDDEVSMKEQQRSWENEVSVMYALASLPNIVRLLAVSKEPNLAIIMVLYDETIDSLVHGSKSVYRDRLLEISGNSWPLMMVHFATDLIEGVSAMHTLKVCHLDLKPQNFLISSSKGRDNFPLKLVIGDFGLARFTENLSATKLPTAVAAAGLSLRYAAPEAFNIVRVLANNAEVRTSSFYALDSYSTAVCIWEMFTRKIPHAEVEFQKIEHAILTGNVPSCKDLPKPQNGDEERVLRAMETIITQGMHMNPEIRLQVMKMRLVFQELRI